MPSLLFAAVGSTLTGTLFGVFQEWTAFKEVPELFILVPILFNLKGNLEMNLASRLSTAANVGSFNRRDLRRQIVVGNIALLQVQSAVLGVVTGIYVMVLSGLQSKVWPSYSYWLLVITSCAASAAAASLLLGLFMCGLVILCFVVKINPDNVATPIAASLGDLMMLVVLAMVSTALWFTRDTYLIPALTSVLLVALPGFFHLTWTNPFVKTALLQGWIPLVLAMLLSSGSGMLLGAFHERYAAMAVLVPVMNSVGGNIGCIYASRRSTFLHAGVPENTWKTQSTLFLLSVPLLLFFLFGVYSFDIGNVPITSLFLLGILFAGMVHVAVMLLIARGMVSFFWKHQLDPDDHVIPLLTAAGDVIGTALLALVLYVLEVTNNLNS